MKKILVIQTAFIGDAVLTLPMIQKLKAKFSDSIIDVISIPSTAEIFSASSSVNKVIILDKRRKHKSAIAFIKFINQLKKEKYSWIYSPHRSMRSSLIVKFLKVEQSFGFDSSSLKSVYKNLVKYRIDQHEVERNLNLIGFDTTGDNWKIKPELVVPEKSKQKVNEFISGIDSDKLIAVSPGSVWNTKKYPKEYFAEIINNLIKDNFSIVLIGSKNDELLCNFFVETSGRKAISTAGMFSIIESIELLKYCKLLISNDSAPAHFGVCADIPVLTLYCSTIAEFGFYPYNRKSSFLSFDSLFCKPCGIHGYIECPIQTFECGYGLKPEIVLNKIEEMLNES